MKLYAVTDEYINYLRMFDNRVYDNKEDKRKVMRKYLGIVLKINQLNYYIPMSSPKKSDYKNYKIKRYANILYKQKINNYDVSYIKSVVDFKLLEDKCLKYKKSEKL